MGENIYSKLKAYLVDHPGVSDGDTIAALNAPGAPVPGVVSPNQLLIWGASTGVRAKIEAGKTNDQVVSLCYAICDMLGSGSIGLDCGNPANQGMLAKLVANGICTQAQADALVAMGAKKGPSLAFGLGFTAGVTVNDLATARSL